MPTVLVTGPTAVTQNSLFTSLAVAVTITSTHAWMTRLSWPGWLAVLHHFKRVFLNTNTNTTNNNNITRNNNHAYLQMPYAVFFLNSLLN